MARPNRRFYQIVCKDWHFEQCVCCGKLNKLTVHHLDRNCWNTDPRNLVWLCGRCHKEVDENHNTKLINQIQAYVRFFKRRISKGNIVRPVRYGEYDIETPKKRYRNRSKSNRRTNRG